MLYEKTVEHGKSPCPAVFLLSGNGVWNHSYPSPNLQISESKTKISDPDCKILSGTDTPGWKKTMKKWNFFRGFDKF